MNTSQRSEMRPDVPAMRFERKSIISRSQYVALRTICGSMMQKDAHTDETGSYIVNSLYFDTPARRDFMDNEMGAWRRRKIRLRSYAQTGGESIFRLEEKFRDGEVTGKRSVVLTPAQANAVSVGDYGCLLGAGETAERFYTLLCAELYRPVLCVQYHREAYLDTVSGLRVTFDTDVRFGSPHHFGHEQTLFANDAGVDEVVLEIKYSAAVPAWLTSAMQRAGCVIGAKSKYADGMRAYFDVAR